MSWLELLALLAYQYMQMLPTIAKGDANKVWIVPSELNKALEGLGSAVGEITSGIPAKAKGDFQAPPKVDVQHEISQQNAEQAAASERTMQEAIAAARQLEKPSRADLPAALAAGTASTGLPEVSETVGAGASDQEYAAEPESR